MVRVNNSQLVVTRSTLLGRASHYRESEQKGSIKKSERKTCKKPENKTIKKSPMKISKSQKKAIKVHIVYIDTNVKGLIRTNTNSKYQYPLDISGYLDVHVFGVFRARVVGTS